MSEVDAGWFRDPLDGSRGRYWDGAVWTDHTVNSAPFRTRAESAEYLEWRFEEYPLFLLGPVGAWGGWVVVGAALDAQVGRQTTDLCVDGGIALVMGADLDVEEPVRSAVGKREALGVGKQGPEVAEPCGPG